MLEDLAIQFVIQSEDTLKGIGLGLTIVGAVIAVIITRSKVEIARTTYFAYSALIFFAVSAVQIVWLQSIPAMTGGYLWVLMAISLTASIAGGYFFCRIAIARSHDAYRARPARGRCPHGLVAGLRRAGSARRPVPRAACG